VERSSGRRGQDLVVVGALLGALLGVTLGLAGGDTGTRATLAAPGTDRAAEVSASPPASQPPVSRAPGPGGGLAASNLVGDVGDQPGMRHGHARKKGEGDRARPADRGKGNGKGDGRRKDA
jgi:hypothetical protein